MSSNISNATFATVLAMCQMMLKQRAAAAGRFLKTADILEVVDEVLAMPSFVEIDKELLAAELEERFTVITGEHQTLGSNVDHKAWLPSRRSEISWRYWDRYLLYLEERVPRSAVDSVDKVTNDVLERIEDPLRQGAWDRRGLVMGHVQSGKTANYCGLVSKAADAGYKVIIVLAGIHNSLRSQTQIRIEEGFLGFMNDTFGAAQQTFKPVGVGLIDSSIRANTGTSRVEKGDFNETVARQFGIHPGGLPLVFVVKKHVGVLNNLIKWIRSCADAQDEATGRKFVRNVPALIIDDEADLASVDTRQQEFDEDGNPDEDHDPAKTNRNIRLLLRSFEKVAYVGYTATPFANIYIHEKGWARELGHDLFPSSFIVNIPPPSNYMGPARIFGLSEDEDAGLDAVTALPIVRPVTDYAQTNEKGEIEFDEVAGWMPPKLEDRTGHIPRYEGQRIVPPSLREAIMAFLLAAAVRKQREKGPLFNSMLIHVVRYTKVQKEVAAQVELALKDIHQRLRYGDGSRTPTIKDEFYELWTRKQTGFVSTTARCAEILGGDNLVLPSWDEIHPALENIASSIRIKIINGSAGDILDYEEHKETGMDLIAVGGDKLSRGLTLEGLSVSYFLRASRMYDTLMQMGRWFGYREKYIDVCRLYTSSELLEWFTHIAAASEELQREFEHMVNVGATPKDYGLKVRSHSAMLVTSAVKMRNGTEMRLSFSGDISETIIFKRDAKWLATNFDAVESWLASLGPCDPAGSKTGGYTWRVGAPAITDLLGRYKSHEDARRADTELLARYIKAQAKNDELVHWTVRLVSSGLAEAGQKTIGGLDVGLVKRAPFPKEQRHDRYTIRRLVSPTDEKIDLTDAERESATTLAAENWQSDKRPSKSKEPPSTPGGKEIRQSRPKSRGMLLIYPLDPRPAELPEGSSPVIGLAISFPKSDTATEVTYTVNNVFTTRGGDDDSL
ncbi:MAG: Z1 domain-containing protein [Verrucomicrobiaceae bacterium]